MSSTLGVIHPTAIVEQGAQIGDGVTVGAFSIVTRHAQIGAGTTIGSHCLIGEGDHGPLVIGDNSLVRSHSVLYSGSTFGEQLETGHRVTLREGLTVGLNLRVGTLGDLQGHATIGDYVRFHSNVHVGHGSTIEDFVFIFPYTVLTNDPHPPSVGLLEGPTVERCAVIATHVTLLPGVRVGRDALVGAGSTVTRDVPPARVAVGSPAKDILDVGEIRWADGRSGSPYPWWKQFRRGYPDTVVFGEDGPRVETPA